MPTITLTLPVSGTVITAGLHSTNYAAIQNAVNGLDNNNIATAAGIVVSKLGQSGATTGQAIVWNGTAWAPATVASVGYGTTLPASPTDGQTAILVDSTTAPTYQWEFRWNNGSTNADKWEFIGGSAAFAEVATSEGSNTTDAYQALTTAGPSFTVPRAGAYIVEIGFTTTVSLTLQSARMSYDIGGTGAVDADSVSVREVGSSVSTGSASRARLKTGLAASTALVAKYRPGGSNAENFAERWMRVTPVRVS